MLRGYFLSSGNRQKDFSWGLGRSTNNHAEWLAFLKGLEIALSLGIRDLVVFGDSLLVIREVRTLVRNYKNPFNKMHHMFNSIIDDFNVVNFLHILQSNSQYADQMENEGVQLDYGFIIYNMNHAEHYWVP